MARFYAEIQGNRGLASRQGNKKSGIWAHIKGWDMGIKVEGYVNDEGEDILEVRLTGGSNDSRVQEIIGLFKCDSKGLITKGNIS